MIDEGGLGFRVIIISVLYSSYADKAQMNLLLNLLNRLHTILYIYGCPKYKIRSLDWKYYSNDLAINSFGLYLHMRNIDLRL